MLARKFSTLMASLGQVFWHFMQPMQPVWHSFMTTGPFSVLWHSTRGLLSMSEAISMTLLGQAAAQAPQPVHFSGST